MQKTHISYNFNLLLKHIELIISDLDFDIFPPK